MYSVPLTKKAYECLVQQVDGCARATCHLVPGTRYVSMRRGGSAFVLFYKSELGEPNVGSSSDVEISQMVRSGSFDGLVLTRFETTQNIHGHNGPYHVRFHALANGKYAQDCLYRMLMES